MSWEPGAGVAAPAGYEVFRDGRLVASGPALRLTDDRLRPFSRHCYAVQAFDASGRRSARSPATCAQTRDDEPPTAPGGLQVQAAPGDGLQLSWLPSADDDAVESYEISRGEQAIGAVMAPGFVETGLTPTKSYCYSVRALDRAKNRSAAAGPVCAVVPDTTPPTTPAEVSASAEGEHSITARWKASTDDVGVARYELATPNADDSPRIIAAGPQTTGREDGLAVATRHCYAARACDAAGNCSLWSRQACATTPDLTPPSEPASPGATAASDTAIDVRWGAATDNVGVTGYEVLRGTDVVARTETATTARVSGLHPAKQYCYVIRALDAAGHASVASSKACATTPDLTPPSAPGRPAAIPVSATQVFLAWDPATDDVGVSGYEVYRGASVVAKVAATRAREYRLEAAHEYCYSVRAFDAAGNRSEPAGPFCTVTARPSDLSAPSDLRVRRISLTNVFLQWEPSEAEGVLYRVYARGDREVGLTGRNTFTPSGLLGAEPSCFRVAAVDAGGRESAKSNEVCAAGADGPLSAR